MSKCFRLLGLSDKATKEQVEDAYRRRVARYKGPDYEEEPEYAHRKLMELRGAYEEALRLARTGDGSPTTKRQKSAVTESGASKASSSSKLRDAERGHEEQSFSEKFHQWLEKRDDKKVDKKNKKTKESIKTSSKKAKSKLSDKFPELKKLNKDNLKSAWDEFKADAAGLAGADFSDDDFDPFDDEEYTSEPILVSADRAKSGEYLTENGTVKETKKAGFGSDTIVKLVTSLIIIAIASFGSCEDDSVSYEDYDYVDEYGVQYEYDYIDDYTDLMDLDLKVKDLAEGAYEELYMQDSYGSAHWSIDTDEELRPIADQFAKKYWGRDSLEEVTKYLQIEFVDYPGNPSMSLDQQLNYIFPFYGFMVVDEAQWYDNPYNGERMQCFADYLGYLNQYYDETRK